MGVPQVWEKIMERIQEEVVAQSGFIRAQDAALGHVGDLGAEPHLPEQGTGGQGTRGLGGNRAGS